MTGEEHPPSVHVTAMPSAMPMVSVDVLLARIEAKVDVALERHGARLDEHSRALTDHETRLRTVESRRTVAPWQLWTAIVGAAAVLSVIFQTMDRLGG